MTLLGICEWLEATALATLIKESQYGFQIVVGLHILGLTLSVGMLVWFDLRLLGISLTSSPASEVYRRIAPWMLTGFALMFVTGTVLFVSFATAAYGNTYFRIKVLALLTAAVNALFFHFRTERSIAEWDLSARPPTLARLAGLTSIIVWAVVILAGRMMSYTMF